MKVFDSQTWILREGSLPLWWAECGSLPQPVKYKVSWTCTLFETGVFDQSVLRMRKTTQNLECLSRYLEDVERWINGEQESSFSVMTAMNSYTLLFLILIHAFAVGSGVLTFSLTLPHKDKLTKIQAFEPKVPAIQFNLYSQLVFNDHWA